MLISLAHNVYLTNITNKVFYNRVHKCFSTGVKSTVYSVQINTYTTLHACIVYSYNNQHNWKIFQNQPYTCNFMQKRSPKNHTSVSGNKIEQEWALQSF